MLFHTPGFLLLFFPIILIGFRFIGNSVGRQLFLLAISYIFYSGADPVFVLLLVATSLVDFWAGLKVANASTRMARKGWLLVSLSANLLCLLFFKYSPLILEFANTVGMQLGYGRCFPDVTVIPLPPGISFYSFQSMSYTIDVYRGFVKPEKSLLSFLNFVAYFPHLVAGPIVRFDILSPQLHRWFEKKTVPRMTAALDRIALGVLFKLLIADSAGAVVDRLSSSISPDLSFAACWAIAIAFGIQIFFDFAAYSHIAIGLAACMGVTIPENFKSPYQAVSLQDFWRRWHITLSTWFRDYVYLPLGGDRCSSVRWFINVMATFMLSGAWHGAAAHFILWGVMHGIGYWAYRFVPDLPLSAALKRLTARVCTFAFVHFAWILFRFEYFSDTSVLWKGMLGFGGSSWAALSISDVLILGAITAVLQFAPNAANRWPGKSGWKESTLLWAGAVTALLVSPEGSQFIYFKF